MIQGGSICPELTEADTFVAAAWVIGDICSKQFTNQKPREKRLENETS